MDVAYSKLSTQLPSSLIGRINYHAETKPSHDAIVSPKLKISYLELTQLIQNQATKLQEAGITHNDVVGIHCSEDIEHLILTLAAISIGTTSYTVPSHDENQVQKDLAHDCGATMVVNLDDTIDLAKPNSGINKNLPYKQTANLIFTTSGTTSKPKLVVHQDIDLVSQAHRHIQKESERFCCLASIEHNFVKRHRIYCLAMGATNIFIENNPERLVQDCLSLEVNVLHVSAFQAQELIAIPDINALSNLRLKLGGSHVDASLRQKLRTKITHNLQAGYGTTETGAIAFTNSDEIDDLDSVGRALPGIEIQTVSPNKLVLKNGERGELAIRCEGMFREYLGNPELTKSRLKSGWFYTGDIGYIDKQQRIHLCGRADDMFTFNSINIYPQDIEAQIKLYPGITDAAVLPKISSTHGSIPIALVVFAKDTKPDLPALKKFLKKKLGIRCPRQIALVDEIPRNTSGKVLRKKVHDLCEQSDDIRVSVIQLLGEHASENIKPATIASFIKGDTDIKLRKFKLDSLARMDLLVALEVNFNTIVAPHELASFRYLGSLVARVLSTHADHDSLQTSKTAISHDTNFSKSQAHIINLFRRVFSYCQTVAQLNRALATFENRVTPIEFEQLYESYQSQQLISSNVPEKFHLALAHWLQTIKISMSHSTKEAPESFIRHKVAPTVSHYVGHNSSENKTLLVCFTAAGAYNMGMPMAVLLQHINADQYDLLLVTEPLNEKYLHGVPHIGTNVNEVVDWIANLKLLKTYNYIRTMGYSAGSYPAIIAGHKLGAESAVSIGGRFHTKSHPFKSLKRLFTTWNTVRKKTCANVLMIYAKNQQRDHFYANIIALFTGGKLLEVGFKDGNIGHLFLTQLVDRGELAEFFSQTIMAKTNGHKRLEHVANKAISFPIN